MHYPTLYAFLLATAVPAATSLAIRSDYQQESISSIAMDIARRSNEDSDETTLAILKRMEADLDGQKEDGTYLHSFRRRGDDTPEKAGLSPPNLDSVLDSNGRSDLQTGIKRRGRRAIRAFVRRSDKYIPRENVLDRGGTPIPPPYEEKRSLLDDDSGITSIIKSDEPKYSIGNNDDGEEDGEEEYEEGEYEDEDERITRRGISAFIARRRAKRSLPR